MKSKKGIVQIIIGCITGIVTANIFKNESLLIESIYTLFFSFATVGIIELIFLFKRNK